MTKNQITEIAKAITKEEANLAVKCLQMFRGTRVETTANGICNALIAYDLANEDVTVSEEGKSLAKAIVKEEFGILVKCLSVFNKTAVSGVVARIKQVIDGYTQEQ